jgi:hypothetical protein
LFKRTEQHIESGLKGESSLKMSKKRSTSSILAIVMILSLMLPVSANAAGGGDTYTLNLSDYADKWELKEADGLKYWSLDVVYCENPVVSGSAIVQHMAIYAPEAYMTKDAGGKASLNPSGTVKSNSGVTYSVATAPILYTNNSGGYSACTVQPVTGEYIEQGYVQVSVGTRGKGTKNAEGEYIGQFPAIITDLKAGIRFMKANSGLMPGNVNRITARGASSGGAVAAMLGASGNSSVFDDYLEEIGAANAADDIFIVLSSCPITNLSSADAAFEWFQHANTEYFLFNHSSR